MLAPAAPVALLAQLAVWLGFFVLGYAFMLEPTTHGFSAAFTQAAVTLFSVGTAHAGGPPNRTVDIAAGATWAVVVTLQIAYLPSLYDAFNRREALVAMLESRAGLPAWGPEVLARHQLVGIIDTLPESLRRLGALGRRRGREPHHLSGPACCSGRPSRGTRGSSGLLAVLDAAAMHLALSPDASSSQARLCLRMGFTTLNRIAKTLGGTWTPTRAPKAPSRLTFEEFEQAVGMLDGDRLPHGAHRRGGVAELPGLAGELRDQRLPVGRSGGGAARAVVGTAAAICTRARWRLAGHRNGARRARCSPTTDPKPRRAPVRKRGSLTSPKRSQLSRCRRRRQPSTGGVVAGLVGEVDVGRLAAVGRGRG